MSNSETTDPYVRPPGRLLRLARNLLGWQGVPVGSALAFMSSAPRLSITGARNFLIRDAPRQDNSPGTMRRRKFDEEQEESIIEIWSNRVFKLERSTPRFGVPMVTSLPTLWSERLF